MAALLLSYLARKSVAAFPRNVQVFFYMYTSQRCIRTQFATPATLNNRTHIRYVKNEKRKGRVRYINLVKEEASPVSSLLINAKHENERTRAAGVLSLHI